MKKYKRVHFFVAPRQQLLYGFFSFISIFLGVGLHTLLQLKKARELAEAGGLSITSEVEIVNSSLISCAIAVLVVGTFTFIMSIFLSHRTHGSLYGIERYFRDLLDGKERGPITTRKYDETKSLVAVLNEYVEKTKRPH